jgi:halimadienyl-diphosphate synthase
MQIKKEIEQLLTELGSSKIGSVGYDTAWIARTTELGEPMGERALDWIRENQLTNGCWGAPHITYHHDRVICTLASITALAQWGNQKDKKRIEYARIGLDNSIRSLPTDIAGATVGFEMLAPMLLREAFDKKAILRQEDLEVSITSNYEKEHALRGKRRIDNLVNKIIEGRKKLERLPDGFVNRQLTMAFSAEMMGQENINLLNAQNLQENNGSIGCSPSATAYFALNIDPGNESALQYLRQVDQNKKETGFPVVAPFDLFEISWALWNLALPANLSKNIKQLCTKYADKVKSAWDDDKGISFSVHYTPRDGDDTGIAYDVLSHYGYDVDIRALLRYKKSDHFHCYETEADPSMSANIHALGALKQAGFSYQDDTVQNIISFLRERQLFKAFWYDKWHASPFYATSML